MHEIDLKSVDFYYKIGEYENILRFSYITQFDILKIAFSSAGLNLHEQVLQFMPVVGETEARISYDITTVLQQLIADELDNLISTLILATNEITCEKEVETISQKHQKELFLSDKEHKRKRIHIRRRNLIRNEQCSQNFTHCTPVQDDGKREQRHRSFGFKQGDYCNLFNPA